MDPKDLAQALISKRAAREADENARQQAADAEAQAERDAAAAMHHAFMTRLVPYFQTLKNAAAGAFDCKAVSDPGRQEISWVVFQFDDRLQIFRVGVKGGNLAIEHRAGAAASEFSRLNPPEISTVIADAADLADENIAALLVELSNMPRPAGLFPPFKTDLDGNPLHG
jgi:hypothetical protein